MPEVRVDSGRATGVVLENGAVAAQGAAADLLADPDLQKAYLGV